MIGILQGHGVVQNKKSLSQKYGLENYFFSGKCLFVVIIYGSTTPDIHDSSLYIVLSEKRYFQRSFRYYFSSVNFRLAINQKDFRQNKWFSEMGRNDLIYSTWE